MLRLFGKTNEKTPRDSIEGMKSTIDMTEKREEFIKRKIEKEVTAAKTMMKNGNKKGAILCVKKKRKFEEQIEQLTGMRMNMEMNVLAIESAMFNNEMVDSVKNAESAMKKLKTTQSIDTIENTIDNIQECIEDQKEIGDILSRPLTSDDIDDDELLAELEDLEQAELDLNMLSIPTDKIEMPNEEEEDLAELRKMMTVT